MLVYQRVSITSKLRPMSAGAIRSLWKQPNHFVTPVGETAVEGESYDLFPLKTNFVKLISWDSCEP